MGLAPVSAVQAVFVFHLTNIIPGSLEQKAQWAKNVCITVFIFYTNRSFF
jgi:hypothetical protein